MRRSRIPRPRSRFDTQGECLFIEGSRALRAHAFEELQGAVRIIVTPQSRRCSVEALDLRRLTPSKSWR